MLLAVNGCIDRISTFNSIERLPLELSGNDGGGGGGGGRDGVFGGSLVQVSNFSGLIRKQLTWFQKRTFRPGSVVEAVGTGAVDHVLV